MQRSMRSMALLLMTIGCSAACGTAAYAQSYPVKPLRMLFGYTAGGTGDIVARLLAQRMADARMLHVPYRGPTESATAVLTGEVDAAFPSVTVALPFVGSGKLKALAVSSAKRAALMPKCPR